VLMTVDKLKQVVISIWFLGTVYSKYLISLSMMLYACLPYSKSQELDMTT
jgi:hypothetical protein